MRAPVRLALAAGLLAGCSPAFVGFSSPCAILGEPVPLPPEIRESSGVAPRAEGSEVLWTHNDSAGEGRLYLLERGGRLLTSVRVSDVTITDWEDLAVGACADGRGCLYLADTGDNGEVRRSVTLYRVPEPGAQADATERVEAFFLRFPDGPRDVEAMYVLPGERVFFVTKGRNHPVEVYRAPPLLPGSEFLPLEKIQTLTESAPFLPRWVTGASASADGRFVAVRTYETLQIYDAEEDGTLTELPNGLVNLRVLSEPQGEAVAFVPSEPGALELVLTSEAGPFGSAGSMSFLRCEGLPEP